MTTLAMSLMDPTVAGIFYLIAVVFFVIAAWVARSDIWPSLVAGGLAFAFFVAMWNSFALS